MGLTWYKINKRDLSGTKSDKKRSYVVQNQKKGRKKNKKK